MIKQTKQGKEFEQAVSTIKKRLESQLKKAGLLKKGQKIGVQFIPEDPSRMPIQVNIWNENTTEILHLCYFHKNGQYKF